ncbi:MerR family transcriptional regulator [Alicyclobacillus tolerans]|uniref:MerR family transcriptional regulator n=1 Tax=Alicyclobacillus tolerans TaxID=90970 RepID=UPI001F01D72E|nr:MerR family transcriptional regulator [Alicyclobacillus tolerans]MCF8565455.1 MerR family transcriptional regulator [Alicyclobacillus tolerans]
MVQRNHQWYRIRQVAEQTGLSPQLIRKWEERYQAITPHRLENGYRVYHQEHVNQLLRLKRLVDNGYSIKNAVLLVNNTNADHFSKDEAHSLAPAKPLQQPLESEFQADNRAVVELLKFGEKSETSRMNSLLELELSIRGIYHVIYAIIIPFLRQVGTLWENGEWTEYQEHIASLQIRDFLVNFRSRISVQENSALLLAACVPGERHEIMLQIIMLEAAIQGWKTHFLGPSPAQSAVADAVKRLRPGVVILSATTSRPFEEHPGFLDELSKLSTNFSHVEFFIGGPGLKEGLTQKNLGLVTTVRTADEFLGQIGTVKPAAPNERLQMNIKTTFTE